MIPCHFQEPWFLAIIAIVIALIEAKDLACEYLIARKTVDGLWEMLGLLILVNWCEVLQSAMVFFVLLSS